MRQLNNYADQRYNDQCVYCGNLPETREHVPPKVFLDRPFPENLPVVEACNECNNGFSIDEEYLACLIECAISGSVDPELLQRKNITKTLKRQQALQQRLYHSMVKKDDGIAFNVEEDRIRKVVRKIALGHVLFELNLRLFELPTIYISPITNLTKYQLQGFENVDIVIPTKVPEVGSRAMQRLMVTENGIYNEGWITVQPGRYRYTVIQEEKIEVRMVFSEYLACQVIWEDAI